MFFKQKMTKRGFTLIELLVVIAIIGILASVVLASLNSARRKSRDARRLADIKQIQVALELYFDDNSNTYPDDTVDLSGASACGGAPCISQVPVDPNGNAYSYDNLLTDGSACAVASAACTSYIIGTTLEDAAHPALNSSWGTDRGIVSCDAAGEFCALP
jgi:prepilin-type N-terminal cleavage/methylation domain-containing protein